MLHNYLFYQNRTKTSVRINLFVKDIKKSMKCLSFVVIEINTSKLRFTLHHSRPFSWPRKVRFYLEKMVLYHRPLERELTHPWKSPSPKHGFLSRDMHGDQRFIVPFFDPTSKRVSKMWKKLLRYLVKILNGGR